MSGDVPCFLRTSACALSTCQAMYHASCIPQRALSTCHDFLACTRPPNCHTFFQFGALGDREVWSGSRITPKQE
eukprot:937159-Pelagomonas_calceolata.AAC.4